MSLGFLYTLIDKAILCSGVMIVSRNSIESSCCWVFHCECCGLINGINVMCDVLFMFYCLYNKAVTHITLPQSGWALCSFKEFEFKFC